MSGSVGAALLWGSLVLGAPPTQAPADGSPGAEDEAAQDETAQGEAATAQPEEGQREAPRSHAYDDVLVPLPESERDEGIAKALMNSAKIAFRDERYEEAIELLAQAYRSYPYVTLLYSLGSAHRRAYELSGEVEHRNLSIRRYQQYLSSAPDAEHADLAQNYLTSLLADRDLGDTELEQVTRLLVSTTAEEAVMVIDDGPPLPAPGAVSVAPGLHHVVVSAPGYFVLERDVDIPEGTTYPVQAELEDIPGRVQIEGPKKASVRIDGRNIGRLPLAERAALEPGEHELIVTKHGHDPYVETFNLERDTDKRVAVELEISNRRFASYFLFGLGTVGIVTSTVLGSLALERQARGQELNDIREQGGSWTTDQLETYNELRSAQLDLRTASFLAGAVGSAVLVTGIVLFARDKPRLDIDGLSLGPGGRRSAKLNVTPGGLSLRF